MFPSDCLSCLLGANLGPQHLVSFLLAEPQTSQLLRPISKAVQDWLNQPFHFFFSSSSKAQDRKAAAAAAAALIVSGTKKTEK